MLGEDRRLTALYFCVLLNVTSFITEKGPFPYQDKKLNLAVTNADKLLKYIMYSVSTSPWEFVLYLSSFVFRNGHA